MDNAKRALKGSEKRDTFKQSHKSLHPSFYACDIDFCLVSKYPPGIVALFDYKDFNDSVTFSEALAYNKFMEIAPVYVIQASNPETGPFILRRYCGANWKPEPPDVKYGPPLRLADWPAVGLWQRELRIEYRKRKGWNGKPPANL